MISDGDMTCTGLVAASAPLPLLPAGAPSAFVLANRTMPVALGGLFTVRLLEYLRAVARQTLFAVDFTTGDIQLPFAPRTLLTDPSLDKVLAEMLQRVAGTLTRPLSQSIRDKKDTEVLNILPTVSAHSQIMTRGTPSATSVLKYSRIAQQLSPLASLPAFFDYVTYVYADRSELGTRIAALTTSIATVEKVLADYQTAQLDAMTKETNDRKAQSNAPLLEEARRSYIPSSGYMARPLISGRLYFTPWFKAALLQAEDHVRRYSAHRAATLEELTAPAHTRLRLAVAKFVAAHEMRTNVEHPNQYKKDKEFDQARRAMQDAGRELVDAANEALGGRGSYSQRPPAATRNAPALSFM